MAEPSLQSNEAIVEPRIETEKLITRSFALLCTAHFLMYSCNLMIDPILSLYLTGHGWTTSLIGVAFAAFSVTSFVTRPLIGRAVDAWSARGTFITGGLALAGPSFLYLLPSPALLLFARLIHGLGWGCINTAGAALTTEAAPPSRRGEALGYYSMMPSLAATVAPALSFWLIGVAGFSPVFAVAGSLATLSAIIAATIPRRPRPVHVASEGGFWSGLIEGAVVVPAVLNIMYMLAQAITVIYISLYARSRGIEDLGVFFLINGLTQFIVGLLARYSDRWGRAPMLAVSFVFGFAGMWWLMQATTLLSLIVGGILFAIGFGLVSPTLIALAVDMAPQGRRGAALATFTASYQIGYASAALLWGYVIELLGFDGMFKGSFLALATGTLVLVLSWQRIVVGHPVSAPPNGS